MSGKIIVASIWTIATLVVGLFAFLLFSATMTGSDLRNRSEMAVFFTGIAIILAIVAAALYVVWSRALR